MDTGRDARGIRSLNRHTLEQMVDASPAGVLVADATRSEPADRLRESGVRRADRLLARRADGPALAVLARAAVDDDSELAKLKAAIGRGEPCRVTVPDLRKDGTSWIERRHRHAAARYAG